MSDQFGKNVIADGVRPGGSIVLAILAGIIAAILGALLWMAVDVGLNMQIGFVAIAIGALVGFAIRLAGNGHTPVYGIIGAILTFAGCLGGEISAFLYRKSSPEHGFFDQLMTTDLVALTTLIFTHMDVISYVIYGIGIYEGYKLSIKK